MTRQPEFEYAGHVGDVDPIAYGGGFVYVDRRGIYPPEMTWFDPSDDDLWHKLEEKTPVTVSRIVLERGCIWTHAGRVPFYEPTATPGQLRVRFTKQNWRQHPQWWFERLGDVARSCGVDEFEMWNVAMFGKPLELAWLYDSLIHYYGPYEFDQYPLIMTEGGCYERYTQEMKLARQR